MKIILYCQHVLGIGHFMRSLALCQALSEHQVILVTGGYKLQVALPPHVTEFRLPALMMDETFAGLYAAEESQSVAGIKSERRLLLSQLLRDEQPDAFVVELYPFGRKQFRFELDPVLEELRTAADPHPRPWVVSSVRDILVEKDQRSKYETRVVQTLNRYFDTLFIHADPAFIKLNETFGRMADISIPVHYTGFITPHPPADARQRIRQQLDLDPQIPLIIASAGGGKVGVDLLEATAGACQLLNDLMRYRLIMFAGPYMEEKAYKRLTQFVDSRIQVRRFTQNFLSYLAAAELSVSMAGYNTSMNLLATRTPALIWPFDQNREQRMRAARMAQRHPIRILKRSDVIPQRLQALMVDMLGAKNSNPSENVDLNGAWNTAQLLKEMVLSNR
jgi:predicted glycosyltransferase